MRGSMSAAALTLLVAAALHFRFLSRRPLPDVIGSGLGGGFQPCGGFIRGWLVPKPIDPGCWRSNLAKSACAASVALAPARIKLILSRHRFASSKSSARAASSILSCNVCIVSSIIPETHDMTEGNTRLHSGHLIRLEKLRRADVNSPANLAVIP